MAGYAGYALLELASGVLGWAIWVVGSLRASKIIHQLLVRSVFGATFRYERLELRG
jgi:hypothetical protein